MTHTEPVNSYDIGDGIVLEADFSQDNAPADPTTVVCLVRPPRTDDAAPIAATHVGVVTNDEGEEVERYKAELTADVSGDWYYRFEGTGAVEATGEKRFLVRRSRVRS